MVSATAFRSLLAALAALVTALSLAGGAEAAGGSYSFVGGTPAQRQQVRAALEASSFPWGIVPGTVVVEIAPGVASQAVPGWIRLDAGLLDSGVFSWGIVQHEYAHQVDFLVLAPAARAVLARELGGTAWCWADRADLAHDAYGCERFASVLAWAYWRSPDNALAPEGPGSESAALAPGRFKALLGRLLAGDIPAPATGAAPAPAAAAAPGAVPTARPATAAEPAATPARARGTVTLRRVLARR